MLHVDLTELAGGTLQEKFDREITRVIENMQDPNTPFGEKRSITVNVTFHQNELRDDAKIEISVKSKLAAVISAKTNFAMGKDLKTGQVLISEYGKQIPGQLSLSDVTPAAEETPENPGKETKKISSMPRALRAQG